MTPEGLYATLSEPHAPALTALGRSERKSRFGAGELPAHLQDAPPQVHILPFEPEQLTPPEPCTNSHHVQRLKTLPLGGLEKSPDFFGVKGTYLLFRVAGRFDRLADVARKYLVRYGLLQGLAQHGV